MNFREILSCEHQNILKMIGRIEEEYRSMESGAGLNKNFWLSAVDFIRHYADKFHHAKEEDILFKELNKDECGMHCNPVPQMFHEHELGRSFVAGIVSSLENNNSAGIISNARDYGNLLRDHIFKEDNILYPMANDALSKELQDEIVNKFNEIEYKFKTEIENLLKLIR